MAEDNEIGQVFDDVVRDVQKTMKIRVHRSPVDIELHFKRITVTKHRRLMVVRETNNDHMEIKIATRVVPEDIDYAQ